MAKAAAAALTVKEAVLLLDTATVQPVEFVIPVIVSVVEPPDGNDVPGIVNVPLDAPIVRVAVLPVAVLAPVRLYVTV
jgi:hypothetical protein